MRLDSRTCLFVMCGVIVFYFIILLYPSLSLFHIYSHTYTHNPNNKINQNIYVMREPQTSNNEFM